jgi:glycosyltransferase involved in cell wall biosynthesis
MTRMGEVVPPANADALAEGITAVLQNPGRYIRPRAEIERLFDLEVTVSAYEELFAIGSHGWRPHDASQPGYER